MFKNDDYCLELLHHFNFEEFKKYISKDVDYDKLETHFQTKEFHIQKQYMILNTINHYFIY